MCEESAKTSELDPFIIEMRAGTPVRACTKCHQEGMEALKARQQVTDPEDILSETDYVTDDQLDNDNESAFEKFV